MSHLSRLWRSWWITGGTHPTLPLSQSSTEPCRVIHVTGWTSYIDSVRRKAQQMLFYYNLLHVPSLQTPYTLDTNCSDYFPLVGTTELRSPKSVNMKQRTQTHVHICAHAHTRTLCEGDVSWIISVEHHRSTAAGLQRTVVSLICSGTVIPTLSDPTQKTKQA